MSVFVHPTAVVSPEAELGDGVKVGPFCHVAPKASIGAGTVLEAHVCVHDYTVVGKNCHIYEFVVLGGDPQDHSYKGEVSWARIGDDNIIRENVTINRATGEGCETVVGDGCFIMDGVHLAHNVQLGSYVTIANKVGLSGFVSVGDHTVLGGMAGVHQFVRIGNHCMIGGLYRVTKDVPPYVLASGEPLRLTGTNTVGLKRAGFSPELRRAIRAFYKELYRKDQRFTVSLQAAQDRYSDSPQEIRTILDFYKGSKRGVTFWGRCPDHCTQES